MSLTFLKLKIFKIVRTYKEIAIQHIALLVILINSSILNIVKRNQLGNNDYIFWHQGLCLHQDNCQKLSKT